MLLLFSIHTNAQVEIYPNPTNAKEMINITTDESSIEAIQFYDMLGNNVSAKLSTCTHTGTTCTQDVSKLLSGAYIVKITLKNGNHRSAKLIKI